MKDSIHLKYLVANEVDLLWGLTINSVGSQSIDPGASYPPGNHPTRYLFSTDRGRVLDEYQLLYITRGEGTFYSNCISDPKKFSIKEGNMFLLFPGEWHNYMPNKKTGWDEYWIGFKGPSIDRFVLNGFFTKESPVLDIGLNEEVVQLYKHAIRIAAEQISGFQQVLGGIVSHLMGLAYSLDKNYSFEGSQTSELINKAKVLILENYKDITPQEIADELNMSYSSFRKKFKEYTGFAPLQYIQELKIQKAKELLTNTSLPIKHIAFSVGYENHEYFFSIFKKLTNSTPVQYRKFTQGYWVQK